MGVEVLSLSLLLLQGFILLVISLTVLRLRRTQRISALQSTGIPLAGVLALANALRLAYGVRWQGPAADIVGGLWFAAPLGLLAFTLWPRGSRRSSPWWEGAWKGLLLAFPLSFLLAGLARIDFRTPFGPIPLPMAWAMAYGPTMIGVTLAFAGWVLVATVLRPLRRALAEAAVIALGAAGVALLVSWSSLSAFVLSAAITWGSGYQLFTNPSPLAPLVISLTLAGAAFIAFTMAWVDLKQTGRPTTGLLLALAVVLSGVFPSPLSILGSLAALELLWWTTGPSTHGYGALTAEG